ncbi:MAG TPA: hypothetical protein VGF28_07790 [Thermoanaerobaculia bacterium]|jgi:hypothetical protein
MTFIQEPTDYTFNASALGVGGYFVRDGKKVLVPSLASVALAPGGGEGWSRVTNYDQDDISFTHAESRVAGYATSPRRFTTYSDILITNLSVWSTFQVAMLHATVTSTRDLDSDDEAQFHLQATYRGVEVDGCEIIPELDIDICHASRYQALAEAETALLDSRRAATTEQVEALARRRKAMQRGEPIRTTLLRDLQKGRRGEHLGKAGRNVLVVPNFASVHFGELLVKPGRRRVNLLRFDFGTRLPAFAEGDIAGFAAEGSDTVLTEFATRALSQNSGTLAVGSGDGNGDPVWPRG